VDPAHLFTKDSIKIYARFCDKRAQSERKTHLQNHFGSLIEDDESIKLATALVALSFGRGSVHAKVSLSSEH
jgi:hypothetical protein